MNSQDKIILATITQFAGKFADFCDKLKNSENTVLIKIDLDNRDLLHY